jgi:hypothetical protein
MSIWHTGVSNHEHTLDTLLCQLDTLVCWITNMLWAVSLSIEHGKSPFLLELRTLDMLVCRFAGKNWIFWFGFLPITSLIFIIPTISKIWTKRHNLAGKNRDIKIGHVWTEFIRVKSISKITSYIFLSSCFSLWEPLVAWMSSKSLFKAEKAIENFEGTSMLKI